jgi:hypothetical protein
LDAFFTNASRAASLSSSSGSVKERYFYLARLFALNGNVDGAIDNLKLAITNGFADLDAITGDREFDPVRNDERFMEFLKNAELLIKLQSDVGLPANPPNHQIQ